MKCSASGDEAGWHYALKLSCRGRKSWLALGGGVVLLRVIKLVGPGQLSCRASVGGVGWNRVVELVGLVW